MSSVDTLADEPAAGAQLPAGEPIHNAPNPFVVVGAALVAGVVLAKWIDWRGHGHPRG
jgi:hypothetical protein